ncbi:hypothetical protein WICPIJ_003762 [Wickerhamomyces pijperi]|uniref:glutathione-specific gamma-glutamylcyclotransferase n=1 Tax=Wickerhamomyces pijperi TaxID=599730 RepID=A0A9P8Q719_WICPI|nr:hypothetical protein WICPIJ_003762 [Wickerhamomyces pijperi]
MTIDSTEKPLWVLGYGSLIFKPPPHAKYRVPGIIYNFSRRFWQSSSDHRGCVETGLGRVLTLVAYEDIVKDESLIQDVERFNAVKRDNFQKKDLKSWACAYYIPAEFAKEVTDYLNVREQDGYTVHEIPFELHIDEELKQKYSDPAFNKAIEDLPIDPNSGKHILTSVVYIGTLDNPSFVGPESLEDTAQIISTAVGPSGTNFEYLEKLYLALNELDQHEEDQYVTELYQRVLEIRKNKGIE